MEAHDAKRSSEQAGDDKHHKKELISALSAEDKKVIIANVTDESKASDSSTELLDSKPAVDVKDWKPAVDAKDRKPLMNTRKKRKLECRICPRRFRTRQAKSTHEQTHNPPNVCKYDHCAEKPKSFSYNSKFREHIRNEHPEIWATEYAPSLRRKNVRVIPESNIVLRRFKCEKCAK